MYLLSRFTRAIGSSSRLTTLAVAALAAGSLAFAPTSAAAAQPGEGTARTPDLGVAVTGKLLQRASQQPLGFAVDSADARVTVSRQSGTAWAFGSAVLTAPHQDGAYPQGWLFLAKRGADGWQVTMEGESAFAALAQQAPVLSAKERDTFGFATTSATPRAAQAYLPWAVGQTWSYWQGPHGWGGYEQPFSSLDLSGGDGIVRAAGDGLAYTLCQGWIRVEHGSGWATDYYHLFNNINVNGASIPAGYALGNIGTDVTCGGSAVGNHTHFALRYGGGYTAIAGNSFGQWIIESDGVAYEGSAVHAGVRVYDDGGMLYNYGL